MFSLGYSLLTTGYCILIMSWFKKKKEIKTEKKVKIPEGLWIKCDSCKEIIYKKEIEKNLQVL